MTPEQYYAKHQRAFRCAFDFLNAHFPPVQDPGWWLKASEDIKAADDNEHGNQLATLLLIGVWDYLDSELKRRIANGSVNSEGE